jgi:hypothetical protein
MKFCFADLIIIYSSDYQQALTMKFNTKEDAIRFAEKQGKKKLGRVEGLLNCDLVRLEVLYSGTKDT